MHHLSSHVATRKMVHRSPPSSPASPRTRSQIGLLEVWRVNLGSVQVPSRGESGSRRAIALRRCLPARWRPLEQFSAQTILRPKSVEKRCFWPILGYLELENAGVSEGVLCTIFRVTSRLERWCIARLIRPPHR